MWWMMIPITKIADEQIEQDADLHQERHRLEQRQTEEEDAVLQDQVADHLGDRLARVVSMRKPVSTVASEAGTSSDPTCSSASGSVCAKSIASPVPSAPARARG